MPDFDPQTTEFSAKNALFLAQLSNAAYETQAVVQAKAASLGLPNFVWIDLTEQFDDVYGFVAGCDEFAVMAFRGTADFKNWMTNVNAAPTRFTWLFEGAPDVGQVHAGFGLALRHAWDQIKAAADEVIPPVKTRDVKGLSTTPQRTLWFTGHSLGGALAALAGAAFSMLNGIIRPVGGIYTFGQPRIGLHDFCGSYDNLLHLKTFRFVNKEDLVPRVPFRGWDYADVGEMIHFDSAGVPRLQSAQWNNFLARTFESFKDFFSITTHFSIDVGDHSRQGYEDLVGRNQSALNGLFAQVSSPAKKASGSPSQKK